MSVTPVSGSIVVRFSHIGRMGSCPPLVANQGRYVSCGSGVTTRCRAVSTSATAGSGVAAGAVVGAAAAGAVVGAAGCAASWAGASEPPHATIAANPSSKPRGINNCRTRCISIDAILKPPKRC